MKTPVLSLLMSLSLAQAAFAGDAEQGEKVAKKCFACHAFVADAPPKAGPNLVGIIGRRTASVEGYAYSNAMKAWGEEGHIWTAEEIDAFIEAPKTVLPGNKMTFAGLKKPEERADLLAYLATLGE
ncbi:cytochrome c family protein [Pseudomonas sp. GX19020]|uniref:c-type cytochrome n=1 Tax=Pseudomonadota TaxID=1224 RepID=UPI00089B327E|nr:cytochrome c family protein [Rhodobacter sp. 24-YEA-8]MCL4067066.1 cytochrome c family protein [Pseudomonas sp. GX19020]SED12643.1 cytochrome c [Rhodobacter sp. 24-YEA-8]